LFRANIISVAVKDSSRDLDAPAPRELRGAATWPWYLYYLRDPLGCVIAAHRRFGDLLVLGRPSAFAGPKRKLVFASSPSHNKLVLGDPELFRTGGQGIPGPRGSAHSKLRFGLTRMQEPKHRIQRQLVLPAVTKSAVDAYTPVIRRIAAEEIERWPLGGVIDMDREMRQITIRVAGETLFGESDRERALRFGRMIDEWLRRSYTPGATYCPLDWPGTAYHGLLQFAERLAETIRALIRERRAQRNGGGDFLTRLVRACDEGGGEVSEDDLLGQTAILFAASFETTATTLAWTLFLLAQFPAVTLCLVNELGGARRDEVDELPYLDAVVKESLRILPPVSLTLRAVTRPTELTGVRLIKGDRIVCSHYLTHRNEAIYPQPNRFDPGRWRTARPGPYEYIPFSAGPRQCIGGFFALRAIKCVLAEILARVRFRVVENAQIDRAFRVTIVPRRGLPMWIHGRDRHFRAAGVRGNIHEMVDLR
jgi:cytochrome P450